MGNIFRFFQGNEKQDSHYKELVERRLPTRFMFSCGYHERFDPFMLDSKPFLVPVYERIFSRFFPGKSGSLLDVGCGTGLYWPVLVKYCDSIVGIDFSKAMISEAQSLIEKKGLGNVEARVQNGEALDFPPESFDAILCMDVLHHIPDIKSAVADFCRVLKPGGRVFAVEPNTFNPLIFLAHLIPPEERIAIKRNYAPVLSKLFSPYFKTLDVHYINFVASAESEEQTKKVDRIGRLMSAVPFLRPFCLRQAIIFEKRAGSNCA
ncbi:MAG: class I SAM-dependent methyltransferase [Nitrospiraceae bacterium]|nr:MAG: class I SAM-dependent methyltransferase [Nitrospiraceae bacterium]